MHLSLNLPQEYPECQLYHMGSSDDLEDGLSVEIVQWAVGKGKGLHTCVNFLEMYSLEVGVGRPWSGFMMLSGSIRSHEVRKQSERSVGQAASVYLFNCRIQDAKTAGQTQYRVGG